MSHETSVAGDKVPGAESRGESEPWCVYNESGTQLYDYDGALIGHLDPEGNVLFGKEARVPAERPVPLLKSFIRWIWGLVGRPAGVACPQLSRSQTDGACDGLDLAGRTPPEDAEGSLGGGVVVDGAEDGESESSAGNESSASVDMENTVPDEDGESETSAGGESSASADTEITVPDEVPGEPWVGGAMGLVRARTAPMEFVESWWPGVGSGSESAEGAGDGGLGGLSGLGGGTLSRTMSA